MPHDLGMKYNITIGNATFSLYYAGVGFLGSHWSKVHHFQLLTI